MCEKKFKVKNFIGIILFMLAFAGIIMMSAQAIADDIWYDEVFSICFSKMSIKELILATSRDVHPPFYYIYLKAFISLAKVLGMSGLIVQFGKFASILPWTLLCIISLTYVRKRWGIFTSGCFMFLVTLMPQIGNYYIEIRMYSLALFLITCAGFIALSIADESKKWKWILFYLIGVLTAYTQYYACIAIIGVYIAFFLLIMISPEFHRRKMLWGIVGCAISSVIVYIPWLFVLVRQFENISGSYWIMPLSLRSIAGCIKYIVLPVSFNTRLCYLSAGLVIFSCLLLIALNILKKMDRIDIRVAICGFIPLITVVISGFILSILGTPIFIYRYMIPCLGLMWFVFVRLIDRASENKNVRLILLIPFLLSAYLTYTGMYGEEHKKLIHMEEVHTEFNSLPSNAIIVCNFDHVASISGYYLDNRDIYLYDADIDKLIPDMLNGCGSYIDDDGVKDLLFSGRPVYFFGSFNSREDIISNWQKLGISSNEEASILLERYWFNVYRLRY